MAATKDHRPISLPLPALVPFLLVLLPLLDTARYAEAQTSPSYNNGGGFTTANINSSTAIVIVVLVSSFFFIAFFAVYIRQCSLRSSPADASRVFASGRWRSRRGAAQRGLDPEVLETFPTLVYSQVKGLKIGKAALECAVCLSEFLDNETLRLLPKCSHVFHPDCIDVWLASHVTCPVCRSDLTVPDVGAAEKQVPRDESVDSLPDHVAIAVGNEVEAIELARIASVKRAQFPRSHTTGHSMGEGCDRYTLRLPEQVRREIFAAGRLRRTASCVVFPGGGEASGRRGYRAGGEGSSRGGRSVRMGGRSDRWAPSFLARALSVRIPAWSVKKEEAVEGPSKGIRGSFNCLGGGGGGGGGDGRSDSAADEDESSTAPLARV